MNAKTLDYYLSLQYDLVIRRIDEEGVQEYMIYTRELDKDTFYGVGSTLDEAIESFNEVKQDLFQHFFERGIEIPEPEEIQAELMEGEEDSACE